MFKVCKKCNQNLHLECFQKEKRMADGYRSSCKICISNYKKDLRKKHKINGVTVSIQEKFCYKCQKLKMVGNFYKNPGGANGLHAYCIDCSKKISLDEKEQNKIRYKNRIEKNPEKYYIKGRIKALKSKFKIKLEDFENMKILQNNLCAICGEASKRTLCIDHNHGTGEVRELLCNGCNIGLSCFLEDIKTLENAIKYLNKHKAQE